jgi:hypothetical protein
MVFGVRARKRSLVELGWLNWDHRVGRFTVSYSLFSNLLGNVWK